MPDKGTGPRWDWCRQHFPHHPERAYAEVKRLSVTVEELRVYGAGWIEHVRRVLYGNGPRGKPRRETNYPGKLRLMPDSIPPGTSP